MSWQEDVKRLQDAGFSDQAISDHALRERQTLTDAGFSQAQVDTHFGNPPFDPKPLVSLAKKNLDSAAAPVEGTTGKPKPVTSFTEALEAGFQMSVTGLLAREKTPSLAVPEDASRAQRIASQVGSLAGDFPYMVFGGLLGAGGGPVGATGGAFALPAGLRRVLMDKYAKGESKTFGDFWDNLSGAVVDTLKGYVVGAATGAVGKVAAGAPIVSPTAQAASTVAAEIATMVSVGGALEGKIPAAQDYIDGAVVVLGAKGAVKTAGKLRNIYAEKGVTPEQLVQDAQKDVTISQDLASDNMDIPRAYSGEPPPSEPTPPPSAMDIPPSGKNVPVSEAQKAILDRVVQEETHSKLTLSDLYTETFDNLNPIKQALKQGGQADLPTSQNPYSLERLTRGTMGKGTEFLKHGAFDFSTYETTTRGYLEILDPVKQDLDGFRAYMVAKRAIEKEGQGITTGVPLEEARTVVREGSQKYEAIFRERVQYREALVSYLQGAGIIDAERADAMRLANKDYVPFYRFFEEQGGGRPSSSKTVRNPIQQMKGGEQQIIDPIVSDIKDTFLFVGLAERNAARQAFVTLGPEYAIKQKQPIRPIQITEPEIRKMIDTFLSFKKETAKTSKTTSATATETTGGGGKTAEAPSRAARLMEDQLMEALASRGRSKGEAEQIVRRVVEAKSGQAGVSTTTTTETIIKELESTTYVPEINVRLPNEVATVFRAMQAPVGKDEIAVFTDGKREVYKVDPKVAEAFQDLDKVSSNFVARMLLHAPASLLRAGVTITPDFISRNIIRDAVSAFIYAGSNPLKTALGMKSLLTQDTAFHNWMKGGGANATMVAIDRDYIGKHLLELNAETGLMQRAWNVAKTPIDLLRSVSELVENATRIGSVRSELLKSQDKARIQALSLISREATVDFARHGSLTQEYAKSTAFFNPALQGIDRFFRAMGTEPVATTAKALAAVTLPSLALWYANRGDKEIADLPHWQKDLFWVTRVPLPSGGSFILRVPKPQEIGIIFGTVPERLLDAYVAENPEALNGIVGSLMQAFAPNIIPTAAVPVISQFSNRNTFTGGTLIPGHLESKMPEYQYTEYTTEAAKAIGRIMGAFPGLEKAATGNTDPFLGGIARSLTSPILVETYVRDWTGGMGMYLLQLADKGLREAGALPDPVKPAWALADVPVVKAFVARYPSAGAQSIQDFHNSFTEKKKVYDTFQMKANEGDIFASKKVLAFDPSAMVQLNDINSALSDHSMLVQEISRNPKMSAGDKRQLIDTIYYRMIELSQFGNTALRKIEKATQNIKGVKE